MFARRSLEQRLEATRAAWRGWLDCFHYSGPREPLVRRSAITLKLCDHLANGAMVAAATSSLPEAVGGTRNWDYRYTWIRDAAFSVYALRRVGLASEAGPSWPGCSPWSRAGPDRRCCTTWTAGSRPRSGSTRSWRATGPRRRCAGATPLASTPARRLRRGPGLRLPVGRRRRGADRSDLGQPAATGRAGHRRVAPARPRHLGGPDLGTGLHLLGGDVPGGAGPRRPAGRTPPTPRGAGPLAPGSRTDPGGDPRGGLGRRHRGHHRAPGRRRP